MPGCHAIVTRRSGEQGAAMNTIVDVQSVDYHNDIYNRYAVLREQYPL